MQQKSAEGLTFFKTVLIHKKLVVVVLVAVKLKKKNVRIAIRKDSFFLTISCGLMLFFI